MSSDNGPNGVSQRPREGPPLPHRCRQQRNPKSCHWQQEAGAEIKGIDPLPAPKHSQQQCQPQPPPQTPRTGLPALGKTWRWRNLMLCSLPSQLWRRCAPPIAANALPLNPSLPVAWINHHSYPETTTPPPPMGTTIQLDPDIDARLEELARY